jgi:hypothetical protein
MLLAAGVASAQDMKKDEAPARAPAAQQNAPAEKVAPAIKPGEHKAGAEQKAPAATTGQAPKASDADKPRATDNKGGAMDKNANDKGALDKTLEKNKATDKGAPKSSTEVDVKTKANDNAQAPAGAKPAQSTEKSSTTTTTTTGQGAASGSAKLSTEQRSQITTVIKQQKVERVEPSKLNISISVGARVPTSVRFYPLPSQVYVIYPEWRGYDYILVGDQILVINPRTHEIVAILDA